MAVRRMASAYYYFFFSFIYYFVDRAYLGFAGKRKRACRAV